jgi:hypothetical protein
MIYTKSARHARDPREFPSEVSSEMYTALRLGERKMSEDINGILKHMMKDQKPKT